MWVYPEILGIPSRVGSKFLRSLTEEHLITPEGENEEDYILEVPHVNERVCYINHRRGPNWMWMYNVLISKFIILILFTHFQYTIWNELGLLLLSFTQIVRR